jgi:hypothetical protein
MASVAVVRDHAPPGQPLTEVAIAPHVALAVPAARQPAFTGPAPTTPPAQSPARPEDVEDTSAGFWASTQEPAPRGGSRIQSYSTMEVAHANDAAIEHHTPKRHG